MCACVPEVLQQYRTLINDGYSMPLQEALAWEEARAVWWAQQLSGAALEPARANLLEKDRKVINDAAQPALKHPNRAD